MSAIGKAIKLFAIGGSLITTNTLWLFGDGKVKKDTKEDDPNINIFDPISPLASRTQKILKDSSFTRGSIDTLGLNFTYNNSTKKNLRIAPWVEMNEFGLRSKYYATTRKQYKSIPTSSIQIQLFDKPAWNNDTDTVDSYKQPLTQDQINDLFKDRDEVLVKQLLHGLQHRREWSFHYKGNDTIYYQTMVKWPGKYDSLTNVKVRFFSDFDDFKGYVHEKVDSCSKEPHKSCVAYPQELNMREEDQESFFRSDYSG